MKITDLTESQICCLRAVLPRFIEESAPLVKVLLEKLLRILEDLEQECMNHKDEEHGSGKISIPEKVELDDAYWQSYAAEIAKEIAVKIANKNMDNDPDEVGVYAANVAKSVLWNLKKK